MSHRSARTTVYARQLMVDRYAGGWPAARIAEQLGISRPTVHKWLRRYREEARSGWWSAPHARTPARGGLAEVESQILALRAAAHRGPVFLAGELGLVASTVGRVLACHQVPALSAVDAITGVLVRRRHSGIRYERRHPRVLRGHH